MAEKRKNFLQFVRIFCFVAVIVLGLVAIVATGGGSAGGDSSQDSQTDDDASDGDDNGSGDEFIEINGLTFSANGYFWIPRDGDKVREETYSETSYTDPDIPDSEDYSETYSWFSGTEISGTSALEGYVSMDGFEVNPVSATYSSYLNNEHRHYKTDFGLNDSEVSGSHIYDPYLPKPLDMTPGQTYSYSYTYTNTYSDETCYCTVNYGEIEYDSILTHYDTYSDCIKFVRTTTYEGCESNDPAPTTYWHAYGKGLVRIETEGEEWSTTSDYNRTYN